MIDDRDYARWYHDSAYRSMRTCCKCGQLTVCAGPSPRRMACWTCVSAWLNQPRRRRRVAA